MREGTRKSKDLKPSVPSVPPVHVPVPSGSSAVPGNKGSFKRATIIAAGPKQIGKRGDWSKDDRGGTSAISAAADIGNEILSSMRELHTLGEEEDDDDDEEQDDEQSRAPPRSGKSLWKRAAFKRKVVGSFNKR